jgi:hypothetical protein
MHHNDKTLNVSPATSKKPQNFRLRRKTLSPNDKTYCASAGANTTASASSASAGAITNIDSIKRPVQLGIAYADVKALEKILVVPLNINIILHCWFWPFVEQSSICVCEMKS